MPVPSSLALTNIADGASLVASDHRNNYTAIQAAVNALTSFFGSGSLGSTLRFDGTNWVRTLNIILDDANSKITFGGDTDLLRLSASFLRTPFGFGARNLYIHAGAIPADGAGDGMLVFANAGTVPTTNPPGGGLLYVHGGALEYRGASGTVTTVGLA